MGQSTHYVYAPNTSTPITLTIAGRNIHGQPLVSGSDLAHIRREILATLDWFTKNTTT